jgi:hypothetical protein
MLFKVFLFALLIYYVSRLFIRPFMSGYKEERHVEGPRYREKRAPQKKKNITDDIGEYIEYEEVKED